MLGYDKVSLNMWYRTLERIIDTSISASTSQRVPKLY